MANVTVLNTTANLSGKTLAVVENDHTITGLWTYDRDPSAPFAVSSSSAYVPNLIAERIVGITTDSGTKVTQVAFKAAQSASTDVNTLDDYEEGSWSPSISFGGSSSGVTASSSSGTYVKVGKKVSVTGRLILTSNGSGSGVAAITNLPFTVDNASGNEAVGVALITAGGSSTGGVMAVRAVINTTTANVFVQGTNNAASATEANLTDTTDVTLSLTYMASA